MHAHNRRLKRLEEQAARRPEAGGFDVRCGLLPGEQPADGLARCGFPDAPTRIPLMTPDELVDAMQPILARGGHWSWALVYTTDKQLEELDRIAEEQEKAENENR